MALSAHEVSDLRKRCQDAKTYGRKIACADQLAKELGYKGEAPPPKVAKFSAAHLLHLMGTEPVAEPKKKAEKPAPKKEAEKPSKKEKAAAPVTVAPPLPEPKKEEAPPESKEEAPQKSEEDTSIEDVIKSLES